jgi:DNA-binding PadR family transcriptional regulator
MTKGEPKLKAHEMMLYNDILMLMSDKWLSTREINMALDRSSKNPTVRATLDRMEEEGIIERRIERDGQFLKGGYRWRLKMKVIRK